MYGYYRSVGWAVRATCLVVVLPVCERLLDVSETQLIMLGLVSAEASLMVLGASQYTWMPFVCKNVSEFVYNNDRFAGSAFWMVYM